MAVYDISQAHQLGTSPSRTKSPRPVIVRKHDARNKKLALQCPDKMMPDVYGVCGSDVTMIHTKMKEELKQQNKYDYFKKGALVVEDTT